MDKYLPVELCYLTVIFYMYCTCSEADALCLLFVIINVDLAAIRTLLTRVHTL